MNQQFVKTIVEGHILHQSITICLFGVKSRDLVVIVSAVVALSVTAAPRRLVAS